ncbi:MAG: AMP-binding protein [Granulosicoccaceae bacterium]
MSSKKRRPIAVQALQHAENNGAHTAVTAGGRKLNYQQLALRADTIARHLKQQTQAPHKSVAICILDPIGFITAFLGARLCGWHVLVLNPEWPSDTQRACLHMLQPDEFWRDQQVEVLLENAPQTSLIEAELRLALTCVEPSLETPFYTGFTSGSEGAPKGFTRHENSWLHSFETDAHCYHLSAEDTIFCPGKLAHSLFLYATLRALIAGAQVCFSEGLSKASQREVLKQQRSTVLFAVPAQLQSLSQAEACFSQVRLVVSAGAKLSPELRQSLHMSLPNTTIIECYGSSELSYIALALPDHQPPPDSVGRPCADVEIQISDADDRPVAAGEHGKILVRSPLRFIGYAKARNTTQLHPMRAIGTYLDSGDTGYMDKDGFLYVTGRSDRMMLIGGHSVFPEQVEASLQKHPAIEEVAVFSVADKQRGERPVAVLKLRAGVHVSRVDLSHFAAKTLPRYALPRQYFLARVWPRTVSDKTDLKMLKATHAANKLEPLR